MRTPISALYRAWLRGWNYSTYVANVVAPHDASTYQIAMNAFDNQRVRNYLLNK